MQNGSTLDLASEEVLVSVTDVAREHKGGLLFFGPDGYLYLGIGDGGISSRAQSLSDLHGKILRIDVNGRLRYTIPPDNPFVNVPGARPEIYALGLRNPWRGAFNNATGQILVGDVGGSSWEEISAVHKGNNLGWPMFEGTHCRSGAGCSSAGLTDPIFEYSHGGGAAVVGGAIYTGSAIPGLEGHYLFGDFIQQQLWDLEYDERGVATARLACLNTNRTTELRGRREGGNVCPRCGSDMETQFADKRHTVDVSTNALEDGLRRCDRPQATRPGPDSLPGQHAAVVRRGRQGALAGPAPRGQDQRARRRRLGLAHRHRARQALPAAGQAGGNASVHAP